MIKAILVVYTAQSVSHCVASPETSYHMTQ